MLQTKALQILAQQLGQPAPLQQISPVEAAVFVGEKRLMFFCGEHHFLESRIWRVL